jgi:DnaJ-class molecular chaperone
MSDLYQRLNIDKSATKAEIKKAYRELAKKLHPDLNKDDQKIADRFKDVSAAYSILGDDEQRAQYDRGEIDENGSPKAPSGFGGGFKGGGFGRSGFGSRQQRREFDMEDAEDLFSEFFSFSRGKTTRQRGKRQSNNPYTSSGRNKGLDISYQVTIGFEESITGSSRRLKLNDGRSVDIKVPGGIKDGQVIRLSGQGGPGLAGAPKGDALVEVRVSEHPYYKRKGDDIHLELPISIDEAVIGGDIQVPTPSGKLTIRIPRNSSTGKRLRLKGKGVQKKKGEPGNMYVTLKIILPSSRDLELEKLIKNWGPRDGDKIRKKAGLG